MKGERGRLRLALERNHVRALAAAALDLDTARHQPAEQTAAVAAAAGRVSVLGAIGVAVGVVAGRAVDEPGHPEGGLADPARANAQPVLHGIERCSVERRLYAEIEIGFQF